MIEEKPISGMRRGRVTWEEDFFITTSSFAYSRRDRWSSLLSLYNGWGVHTPEKITNWRTPYLLLSPFHPSFVSSIPYPYIFSSFLETKALCDPSELSLIFSPDERREEPKRGVVCDFKDRKADLIFSFLVLSFFCSVSLAKGSCSATSLASLFFLSFAPDSTDAWQLLFFLSACPLLSWDLQRPYKLNEVFRFLVFLFCFSPIYLNNDRGDSPFPLFFFFLLFFSRGLFFYLRLLLIVKILI